MASELLIRLGLDDKRFYGALSAAENRIKRFGNQLEGLGRDLTTRVSVPLGLVGAASIKTFASFEKTQLGLEALYGSAEVAKKVFDDLLNTVKDTQTTLDFDTATKIALQFKAVGIEGDKAVNIIKQLGIAATVSGSSSDDVGEVGRQLTQAASKGRILQQELRIILERIPALAGVMKQEFGVVTADALRDAGVSADEFIDRLTKGIQENERFQSVQGGLSKAIETFGIELQIAGAEIGKAIAKSINLEKVLSNVNAFVSRLADGFANLNPGIQKAIVIFAGIAAAIGPLLIVSGAVIKSVLAMKVAFTVLTGPIGIVIAAIGVAVAAFATFYNRSARFRALIAGIGASLKTFAVSVVKGFAALFEPIGLLIEGKFKEAGEAARKVTESGGFLGVFSNAGDAAGQAYTEAFENSLAQSRAAEQAASLADKVTAASVPSASSFGSFAPAGAIGGGGSGGRRSTPDPVIVPIRYELPDSLQSLSAGDAFGIQSNQIRDFISIVEPATSVLTTYGQGLRDIQAVSEALGTTQTTLQEKFDLTREALTGAVLSGEATSSEITYLTEQYGQLQLAIEGVTRAEQAKQDAFNAFNAAFSKSVSGQVKGFRQVGAAALDAAAQVISAKLREAVAAFIADSFGKLGIFGAILAAGAGAAVGGIFSAALGRLKIPALAEGGLVTSPTLALIGEAGPELVTPLDRVGDMFGGGGGRGEFVVRGSDLVLVLERANAEGSRIRGF